MVGAPTCPPESARRYHELTNAGLCQIGNRLQGYGKRNHAANAHRGDRTNGHDHGPRRRDAVAPSGELAVLTPLFDELHCLTCSFALECIHCGRKCLQIDQVLGSIIGVDRK